MIDSHYFTFSVGGRELHHAVHIETALLKGRFRFELKELLSQANAKPFLLGQERPVDTKHMIWLSEGTNQKAYRDILADAAINMSGLRTIWFLNGKTTKMSNWGNDEAFDLQGLHVSNALYRRRILTGWKGMKRLTVIPAKLNFNFGIPGYETEQTLWKKLEGGYKNPEIFQHRLFRRIPFLSKLRRRIESRLALSPALFPFGIVCVGQHVTMSERLRIACAFSGIALVGGNQAVPETLEEFARLIQQQYEYALALNNVRESRAARTLLFLESR